MILGLVCLAVLGINAYDVEYQEPPQFTVITENLPSYAEPEMISDYSPSRHEHNDHSQDFHFSSEEFTREYRNRFRNSKKKHSVCRQLCRDMSKTFGLKSSPLGITFDQNDETHRIVCNDTMFVNNCDVLICKERSSFWMGGDCNEMDDELSASDEFCETTCTAKDSKRRHVRHTRFNRWDDSSDSYETSFSSSAQYCEERTVRGIPKQCHHYMVCHRGLYRVRSCPRGRLFDEYLEECVPERYSSCGHHSHPKPKCREGERKPHSKNCKNLFECRFQQWVELSCPTGFVYDSPTNRCVRGDCNVQYFPIPPSSPGVSLPTIPAKPNPKPISIPPTVTEHVPTYGVDEKYVAQSCQGSFRLIDQFDCTRYWECDQYQRFVSRQCPPMNSFDIATGLCVRGFDSCNANRECNAGSFQPMEKCGEFRVCHEGQYINGRCDSNKKFINGKCSRTESCPNPDDYQPAPDRECHTGSIKPVEQDKTKYLACQYGKWVQRSCPSGMEFFWDILRCTNPSTGPSNPTQPKCYEGQTRNALQGNTKSCDTFEVCRKGMWVVEACEYGMIYENGYCVRGKCNKHDDTSNQSCVESGGPEGYRRVSHDCSKYYQCVHGAWMERPCAPGTAWNPRLTVCDHKGNVPECGYY
ncbi:unnamed protein product [Auanema sp. JU1783]|nr:unnamed protein product [Auanema sp. JU1783]